MRVPSNVRSTTASTVWVLLRSMPVSGAAIRYAYVPAVTSTTEKLASTASVAAWSIVLVVQAVYCAGEPSAFSASCAQVRDRYSR